VVPIQDYTCPLTWLLQVCVCLYVHVRVFVCACMFPPSHPVFVWSFSPSIFAQLSYICVCVSCACVHAFVCLYLLPYSLRVCVLHASVPQCVCVCLFAASSTSLLSCPLPSHSQPMSLQVTCTSLPRCICSVFSPPAPYFFCPAHFAAY
jgi:hypothetical protein